MLQDRLGGSEGQLRVKEKDLKRVEKQLEAQASGGVSEPAGRCVKNQTRHSGEELPKRRRLQRGGASQRGWPPESRPSEASPPSKEEPELQKELSEKQETSEKEQPGTHIREREAGGD